MTTKKEMIKELRSNKIGIIAERSAGKKYELYSKEHLESLVDSMRKVIKESD